MNETEDLLRAALAATPEPAEAGFAQRVATRVDATERRRAILLALLMTAAALLLAAMFVGLFSLAQLWAGLAQQNWFSLSPAALNLVSMWASIVGVVGLAAIALPLVRSRA